MKMFHENVTYIQFISKIKYPHKDNTHKHKI